MATRTEQKAQVRREREQREQAGAALARRNRRLRLVGITLAAAAALVIAAIAVSSSSGKKQSAPTASAPTAAVSAIPQEGLTLGNPNAPVTIREYADLQCPVCDDFALNVLPQVEQNYVRTGKAKVVYENFPILGQDSVTAANAAAAAGLQNKAWDFVDLWYHNQGTENSGYVTDSFIRKIAAGVPGLDVNKLMTDRNGAAAKATVRTSVAAADSLGFNGTPSFVLLSASGKRQVINGTEPSYAQIAGVIDTLLKNG